MVWILQPMVQLCRPVFVVQRYGALANRNGHLPSGEKEVELCSIKPSYFEILLL